MKFAKSWHSHNKNGDRIQAKIRIGSVTVIELWADMSQKKWRVGLFNYFLSN